MARTRFKVGRLFAVRQARQQAQRGKALPRCRDIIVFTFDDFHRNCRDLTHVHGFALNGEGIRRDLSVFEDTLHG